MGLISTLNSKSYSICGQLEFAMQSEPPLKHLLSVIRSHHIGLTDEDIRLAFDTSREDAIAWVNQCLGKETLLSFEEAHL